MFYEINVALNGKHYFATAPRSIVTAQKAIDVWNDFVKRFPANDSFEIHCSKEETVGFIFSREELAEKL